MPPRGSQDLAGVGASEIGGGFTVCFINRHGEVECTTEDKLPEDAFETSIAPRKDA